MSRAMDMMSMSKIFLGSPFSTSGDGDGQSPGRTDHGRDQDQDQGQDRNQDQIRSSSNYGKRRRVSMALQVKDGLAMRLTKLGKKVALSASALALAWAAGPGCHRQLPYIDQSKTVPHDALGSIAEEDQAIRQANYISDSSPINLPKITPPRTTENPEAEEIWELTLPEAIKIAMDNAETIRVIALGAQGTPVSGFEPTPLNTGAGGGSALGSGTLFTVYDPAIQESQIAEALSVFDAQFQTNLLWGRNVNPVNNGIQAGQIGGPRFPVIFDTKNSQFQIQLQKRAATGTTLAIGETITNTWSNNSFNAFPSAYTSQLQVQFVHPLLGGDPQNPSGLQANRAPIVITRLQSDQSVWQFKQQMMSMVRSVEQQYWSLAQQHVQLWSRETAVKLGEEILKRELAEAAVGRGTVADVSEAEEQLESFKLQLVRATADTVNTERQLRNILGLPPSDNRRIVPATAPTDARIQPDWDACVSQMISYHPEIVVQQLAIRVAELNLLIARNQLLPRLDLTALYGLNGLGRQLDDSLKVQAGGMLEAINPLISRQQTDAGLNVQPAQYKNFENWQVGLEFRWTFGNRGPLARTRAAQFGLLRQRAFLQQTVHQSTHNLARFFLEVDSNFKSYKSAGRARAAAARRLEVQRARYEVGEITIDRYLDAVNRWANQVASEAEFKTAYNTAIITLEEAKGTLLAYNNIAVMEGPYPAKAYGQAQDQQAAHIQHSISNNASDNPQPSVGDYNTDPVPSMPPQIPPGEQPGVVPPVPAPGGPFGPQPTPTMPRRPVGYPETGLNENVDQLPIEINVRPASVTSEEIDTQDLPPLP